MKARAIVLALAVFAALAQSRPPATTPRPTPAPLTVANVPSGLVVVHATAERTLEGTIVTGLTRGDFSLLVEGQPRAIEFFSAVDEPVTMVLLLDVSASFTARFGALLLLDAIEQAFLPGLKPGDRLRVGNVTGGVEFLTPFTADRRTILEAIRGMTLVAPKGRYGPSPLWDGVDAAITALAPEPGRRAVVLITDGRSTGNHVSYKDVAAHAMATGVMLHFIGKDTQEIVYRESGIARTAEAEVALRLLADSSGGSFRSDTRLRGVPPDRSAVAGLWRLLARMTNSLHQVYTLGFQPVQDALPTHTVEVVTSAPGVIVRARQGYGSANGPK